MSKPFKPDIGVHYLVYIDGRKKPLRIEFTNEHIQDEERFLGWSSYECWDEEEIRYIYYCDEDYYSSHVMKTKTIDGDIIEFYIKNIKKIKEEK
jgi:hypothetical protein